MNRFSLFALLFCFFIASSYAQDSTKTATPKSAEKPVLLAPPVKTNKITLVKPDTGKNKAAINKIVYKKPDSTEAAAPVVDKSLNGQYLTLLTKVYHYQQPFVATFWASVHDTLTQVNKKLKETEGKLALKTKYVDSLKADSAKNAQAAGEPVSKTVSFFGIDLSLTVYNIIVWGLAIFFAIYAFYVIARSGGFKTEAEYRTRLYSELEDEFKAYKSKANEKEKKLARELQTERNKLDELLGRG